MEHLQIFQLPNSYTLVENSIITAYGTHRVSLFLYIIPLVITLSVNVILHVLCTTYIGVQVLLFQVLLF